MLGGDFSVIVTHFDRALFLVVLYGVFVITRADPYVFSVVFNIPILGVYTASVTYLTYRRFGASAALYAAILTPFSPMFLSFVYGGFQADLAALSVVFVAAALMSGGSRRELVAGMVLMLVSMFVHRWTWVQYILILGVYTLLLVVRSVIRGEGLDPRVRLLAPYVVASLALDFLLQAIFPGYGLVRSARTLAYSGYLGQGLLGNYWWMINVYTGASLNHLPYYLLALVAVPAIELVVADVAALASLVPFLALGNVISYRVLINSPLPVFASYGVARLNPRLRLPVVIVVVGLGLFRLITMIPGLPLV